jgi:hypothetical protein
LFAAAGPLNLHVDLDMELSPWDDTSSSSDLATQGLASSDHGSICDGSGSENAKTLATVSAAIETQRDRLRLSLLAVEQVCTATDVSVCVLFLRNFCFFVSLGRGLCNTIGGFFFRVSKMIGPKSCARLFLI